MSQRLIGDAKAQARIDELEQRMTHEPSKAKNPYADGGQWPEKSAARDAWEEGYEAATDTHQQAMREAQEEIARLKECYRSHQNLTLQLAACTSSHQKQNARLETMTDDRDRVADLLTEANQRAQALEARVERLRQAFCQQECDPHCDCFNCRKFGEVFNDNTP